MKSPKPLGQAGFTLIESLLAVIIAGVSLAGLIHLFAWGQIMVERNSMRRQALLTVQNHLESLRRERFNRGLKSALPDRPPGSVEFDYRGRAIDGELSQDFVAGREPSGLSYQAVRLTLLYKSGDWEDTVALSTRFYHAN
jgi:prepilin-type N-terminal cleavage/methylation domain-containing protein